MWDLKDLTTELLLKKLYSLKSFKKIIKTNNSPEYKLFQEAYMLAQKIHADEMRFDNTPYINHPLRVTINCLYLGADSVDIIIAALLHDSVENHASKLTSQIANYLQTENKKDINDHALIMLGINFGDSIEKYVSLLTNPDWSNITDSDERKKLYAKHIEDIVQLSPETSLIKLADFLDNSLSLPYLNNTAFIKNSCKRYAPLFQVFITAILDGKILLAKNKISIVIKDLVKGWLFVRKHI